MATYLVILVCMHGQQNLALVRSRTRSASNGPCCSAVLSKLKDDTLLVIQAGQNLLIDVLCSRFGEIQSVNFTKLGLTSRDSVLISSADGFLFCCLNLSTRDII